MTSTPNLALPYLAAAQAQKHVTHNEALRLLDAMVQLSVLDRTRTAPPASPADGDRHLVASGATGAWAGWDLNIAYRIDGAWIRLVPRVGWQVWVADEGVPLVWNGTAWQDVTDRPLQVPRIGVNASSDNTNRLSVASPATLLNHAGAGHQLKINKATAGDTGSVVFQTGWSGRAEIGTTGSDDLAVRVSPDGTAWSDALVAEAASGMVRLPAGLRLPDGTALAPPLAFADDSDTGLFRQGADALGISTGGAERLRILSTAVRALVALRLTDGTAAAPAATFESDPDTGLFRAGADALGISTGGAERARVTSSGLQVTGQITGTAVTQSTTDSTVGRLLKVRDFGIGLLAGDPPTVPGGDIDAFSIPSGWYRFNNAHTGTLPPGMNSTSAILQNWWRVSSGIVQLVLHPRTSPERVAMWIRYSTGNPPSGWTAWRQIYTQSDILGTVSQSGGVPTGAVIERGSNSNGEYVRFADGTQICSQRLTDIAIDNSFGSGGLFRSNTFSWTFPATFVVGSINGANVFGRVTSVDGLCVQIPHGNLTTQATEMRAVATASVASTDVFLTATGRWF
jgi:hypothetical protein